MDVELPDGTIIRDVPDGITKDQLRAKLKANGMSLEEGAPAAKEQSGSTFLGRTARDLGAGAVRGAGSIGATLLAPLDAAYRASGLPQNDFIGRTDRRESMDGALRSLVGADTDSFAYGAGKLGTEVAGTLGAGGVLGAGARLAGQAAPSIARGANVLADSLASSGMRLGGGAPNALLAQLSARVAGGAGAGAASAGLVDPTDAGLGAVIGGAAPPVFKVANALGGGAAGIIRTTRDLSTEAGRNRIAEAVLRRSATDPQAAARTANAAGVLVPGSIPTTAQVANDPGLAQLERTLFNNPETAGPLNRAYDAQRAARGRAIEDVAATGPNSGSYYDDIVEGRRVFANEDYAKARKSGIDPEMARSMQPQINSLMSRPSIKSAIDDARRLAAETGEEITDIGSVQGLDWVRKALANQISRGTSRTGSALGKEDLRALEGTMSDLTKTLEQIAPDYATANRNYAQMSRQVNSMDVARDLDRRYTPDAAVFGQSSRENGAQYMKALREAQDSVKRSTGMDKSIDQVMNAADNNALTNVARDLARKDFAQNSGKAVGSNTAQNVISQQYINQILADAGVQPVIAAGLSQSPLLATLLRPVQFAGKLAMPGINNRLAELMSDPALAAAALQQANPSVARSGSPLAQLLSQGLPAVAAGATGR
jgi:hypothetical protein